MLFEQNIIRIIWGWRILEKTPLPSSSYTQNVNSTPSIPKHILHNYTRLKCTNPTQICFRVIFRTPWVHRARRWLSWIWWSAWVRRWGRREQRPCGSPTVFQLAWQGRHLMTQARREREGVDVNRELERTTTRSRGRDAYNGGWAWGRCVLIMSPKGWTMAEHLPRRARARRRRGLAVSGMGSCRRVEVLNGSAATWGGRKR